MTEEEMVEWHHRLNGHKFEQAVGVGDGQGSLACCSPWGRKESDMTERMNDNKTFSFMRTLHTVCVNLHFSDTRVLFSPHPRQHLLCSF